jgi:hypothetical protein
MDDELSESVHPLDEERRADFPSEITQMPVELGGLAQEV